MKINKKTRKPKKQDQLQKEIDKYKFHRVGIIKDVKFGLLPGTILGAFVTIHDGGFGMSLTILEVSHGFPINYTLSPTECEEFFKHMEVTWHTQLKGKHVLLLSNSDAINYVEKVVLHKDLMKEIEETGKQYG